MLRFFYKSCTFSEVDWNLILDIKQSNFASNSLKLFINIQIDSYFYRKSYRGFVTNLKFCYSVGCDLG